MAFSAAAFAAAAVTAAGAILKFESENVLNDGPGAIAGPSQPGAVNSVAQAIARQTCRRYADGVDGLDESTAVNLERVCRPYLDNIGYGSGPELVKPFEGGQCDGEVYFVTSSFFNPTNGSTATFTGLARGPVGGVRLVPAPAGTGLIFQITCRGYAPGAGCASIAPQLQPLQAIQIASTGGNRENARIDSISPCGFSDDCGNPPPEFTEPIPPPNPDPPTEPFNPEPEVDIDITVNLRPDSLVEVNLGLGPIVAPVFGGGDGTPGGGDSGGPTTDPDTSPPAPEPGPENPGGNGGFGGDDEFGPPPAGRRWVGCCIKITNTPQNAGVIVGSEPEDVYPSVIGNIRLVCNAAGNRLTDTPVRILAKNVCVWEPVSKLNPTGVNVDLLPGYGYTFRPFSVPSGD